MTADRTDLADLLGWHPLLPLAWRVAGTAGRFLADERPAVLPVDSKSTPTDSVTEMDRGAEALIRDTVLGARPDDGMLGEEGTSRPGTSGVRWIVDPLDGTVNYLYRLPMWGVSIGVEVDGVPTVGVVVTPAYGEAYVAIAGRGAWLVRGSSAERLQVGSCARLSEALVTTGFGYDPAQRARQAGVVTTLIPRIRDVRRHGAAVIDFCWLARGRVDAYYEEGLNHWDHAAGALIAHEAGAVVGGLGGVGLDRIDRYVIAAVPGIAAELRSELTALLPGVSTGA